MSAQIFHRTPTLPYRLATALVAGAMLLLPVIYVALTVAVGYGVYAFAVHDFPRIWAWPLGHSYYGLVVKVVASCTPLLVGGAVAISMIKPLFAGRGRRMQPLALNPEFEPRIHELTGEISSLLGSPPPVRIQVNCDINASAGFERGLRGMLANRLVLTLGMPLVAGLSQRELAGVIAHELGHFRQGGGMRMSYLIRRVNGWFARVIYQRDAWDEAIEAWAESSEGWMSFMVGCTRLGIWFSRRVLWVLMTAGHAICSLLLRQMEYDADRAEIQLAGSAAFESTTHKIALFSAVESEIRREMRRTWSRTLQLPDNLPVLLEYRVGHLSSQRRAKIENEATLGRTGWLDTHPGPADRVRQARSMAEPGYDLSDEPARELFENFDTVSRLVTLAHYEDDLNVPTSPDHLIPLEQIIRSGAASSSAPPAPKAAPISLMNYDPAGFQRPPDSAA